MLRLSPDSIYLVKSLEWSWEVWTYGYTEYPYDSDGLGQPKTLAELQANIFGECQKWMSIPPSCPTVFKVFANGVLFATMSNNVETVNQEIRELTAEIDKAKQKLQSKIDRLNDLRAALEEPKD